MMPPISSSGMNTATSEMLMDRMVKPISPAPLSVACSGDRPCLDVAVDVLEHHDGVVDHEADGDGERHQRQIVQAVAEQSTSCAAVPSSASGTVTPGMMVAQALRRNRKITITTSAMVSSR